MTAVLDLFDDIECVCDQITKDPGILSNALKLPQEKILLILDQNESAFSAQELASILRRAEEVLSDKKSGKLRLPADLSKLPETTTSPTFYVKETPSLIHDRPPMAKEKLKIMTIVDRSLQKRMHIKAKLEKIFRPWQDVPKAEFVRFFGHSERSIMSLYVTTVLGSLEELECLLRAVKESKESGRLKSFVVSKRKAKLAKDRYTARGMAIRAVFQSYFVNHSAIADSLRIPISDVRDLMNTHFHKLSRSRMAQMENFAMKYPTRASLFCEEIKFSPDHGEDFRFLYTSVRDRVKTLDTSEIYLANGLHLPHALFNSLRSGTFRGVTPNTLHVLKDHFRLAIL